MLSKLQQRYFVSIVIIFCGFYNTSFAQSYFSNPESAIYDEVRDRYFVTNVGNGRIIEIDSNPDTTIYYYATPHVLGMVIVDDTLYVTNASRVLAFNLVTDVLHRTYPITGASDLNDITYDGAGYLYMTNSAGQVVHKLNMVNGSNSVIASGIYWPNGILYDPDNNYLLMCSFGSNVPIRSISLDGSTISIIVWTSYINLDGITEDNNGNIYVSSWGSNSIYRYDRLFNDPPVLISSGHSGPADIYFDRINNILVVPNFNSNSVDFLDMDLDDDGILNIDDNCPSEYNPGQEDGNDNDIGDVCDWICGDVDGVEDINILDIVYLINFKYKNGPAPEFMEAANVNNDEDVNILDIVYLINFKYKDGPEPDCPQTKEKSIIVLSEN